MSSTAAVDMRLAQIESLEQSRKRAEEEATRNEATTRVESSGVVTATDAPKHPAEAANGPKHTIDGVIHDVACSYPAQMDLSVAGLKKTFKLYSMNYMKIDYSVLGFKPTDKLDPCTTMEGLRAHVVYAESSDKTVDGQVISILLKK